MAVYMEQYNYRQDSIKNNEKMKITSSSTGVASLRSLLGWVAFGG